MFRIPITEMAAFARTHDIRFPLLKDRSQSSSPIASARNGLRTVFVLDDQRIIRYWGRIDDQYGVGYVREEPQRHDLQAALDELLAGKEVTVPVTEAVGCQIGRIKEPQPECRGDLFESDRPDPAESLR